MQVSGYQFGKRRQIFVQTNQEKSMKLITYEKSENKKIKSEELRWMMVVIVWNLTFVKLAESD
jgi:propanediol dehydratase small subunit